MEYGSEAVLRLRMIANETKGIWEADEDNKFINLGSNLPDGVSWTPWNEIESDLPQLPKDVQELIERVEWPSKLSESCFFSEKETNSKMAEKELYIPIERLLRSIPLAQGIVPSYNVESFSGRRMPDFVFVGPLTPSARNHENLWKWEELKRDAAETKKIESKNEDGDDEDFERCSSPALKKARVERKEKKQEKEKKKKKKKEKKEKEKELKKKKKWRAFEREWDLRENVKWDDVELVLEVKTIKNNNKNKEAKYNSFKGEVLHRISAMACEWWAKQFYFAVGIFAPNEWRFIRAEFSLTRGYLPLRVRVQEFTLGITTEIETKHQALGYLWRICQAARTEAQNSHEWVKVITRVGLYPETISVGNTIVPILGKFDGCRVFLGKMKGREKEVEVALKPDVQQEEIDILRFLEQKNCSGVQRVVAFGHSPANENQSLMLMISKPVGSSLYELVEAKLPSVGLDPDWVLEMALSLLRSLAEIHHAGVLHRNISPYNIIYVDADTDWVRNGNPQYLFIDFGCSCLKEKSQECLQTAAAMQKLDSHSLHRDSNSMNDDKNEEKEENEKEEENEREKEKTDENKDEEEEEEDETYRPFDFTFASAAALRNRAVLTPEDDIEALLWSLFYCLDWRLPWDKRGIELRSEIIEMKEDFARSFPTQDPDQEDDLDDADLIDRKQREKLKRKILMAVERCRYSATHPSSTPCHKGIASLLRGKKAKRNESKTIQIN